jgi:hypothetical protein
LWGILALLAAVTADAAAVTPQDAAPQRADQLKAGYLGNFVKFVEWPSSTPADTLTVCFVGAPGVRTAFGADAAAKKAGTRRLMVREFNPGESPAGCDVIYMDGATSSFQQLSEQWSDVQLWAVLTVSDKPDFTRRGGVIGLFTQDNRLRFTVNVQNARRAGLRLSAALLQLATNIEKESS